jgi:transposase
MDATAPTDLRRERGYLMAKTFRITKGNGGWTVPSQSGRGTYLVTLRNDKPTCTCLDYGVHRARCKHIYALEAFLKEKIENPPKAKRITYSQDWSSYDKSQIHQKELFMELLNDLCQSIPNPEYNFGRPKLPLSDMVFASALKVFTTFSLRRFVSDMQIAKEKGFIEKVPYYSTVARYMENEKLIPILNKLIEISSLPLKEVETDFAVDSSGFGTSRFDRWFSFKYGKEIKSNVWIKAHLMNGIKTHIITGVKITGGYGNDSPQFEELVNNTAKNFTVNEVSADKAYSSRDNLNLVNELGGTPYIPFKNNTTGKSRGSGSKLWNKLFYYFMYNHDEFQQHYHKRSNAETVFHMIKAKFGDSIRSKTRTAQINEVLCKILCHNICVLILEMKELEISIEWIK